MFRKIFDSKFKAVDENLEITPNLDLYSLALKNAFELGKYSFELEKKRETSIISQASQMLTAFSVFSAAVLMAVPILLENISSIDKVELLIWAGVMFVFLIASLCFSIIAQWRFKYKTIQNAAAIRDHMFKKISKFEAQSTHHNFWIEQLTPIHKSIEENNNRRAKFVKFSMGSFLCSIAVLILAALRFLLPMLFSLDTQYVQACIGYY